jgi:hypothetical protein
VSVVGNVFGQSLPWLELSELLTDEGFVERQRNIVREAAENGSTC